MEDGSRWVSGCAECGDEKGQGFVEENCCAGLKPMENKDAAPPGSGARPCISAVAANGEVTMQVDLFSSVELSYTEPSIALFVGILLLRCPNFPRHIVTPGAPVFVSNLHFPARVSVLALGHVESRRKEEGRSRASRATWLRVWRPVSTFDSP